MLTDKRFRDGNKEKTLLNIHAIKELRKIYGLSIDDLVSGIVFGLC